MEPPPRTNWLAKVWRVQVQVRIGYQGRPTNRSPKVRRGSALPRCDLRRP
jgi:hypothetical protein